MSRSFPSVIRVCRRADMPAVLALLRAAALPTSDLTVDTDQRWWVLEFDGSIVGVIGLQEFGTEGLLRSLAVSPTYHQQGIGRELVTRLEREALKAGIQRLVLLTQTAGSFFRHLGYAALDRRHVSEGMKQCAEFSSLCPESATCMAKALELEPSRAQANG